MHLALVPLLAGVLQSCHATSGSSRFDWHDTKYVYAFGDSYTYVQGSEGLTNFSFIGDAFDFSFTPQRLLSNEIILNFTSSDGANWIEFLTGCMSGRPTECSRQLWNFAFAGADIDGNLLPLHHNFTVPLIDQVRQWVLYAADVIPHPARETLTAWWIGINDTGDSFNNASISDWDAFWEAEMTSYFNAVQTAYDHDLRGTYLFITVPPGQREPAHIGEPSDQALLQKHREQFNTKLAAYIREFGITHPDMTVLTFDSYTWFNGILNEASRYGFANTTGPGRATLFDVPVIEYNGLNFPLVLQFIHSWFCECSDPSFFWFNSGHPTERVHQLLALAIEAQLLEASHR